MSQDTRHGTPAALERESGRPRRSGRTSGRPTSGRRRIGRLLRENALSLAAFGLFLLFLLGEAAAGIRAYNDEQREHGQPAVGVGEYLRSGNFIESTVENWESEFLEMAFFVLLTAKLRQKGSPESKKLDGEEEVDEDPRAVRRSSQRLATAPWAVRRGGLVLAVYEHSLSIALGLLFATSFALHVIGGAMDYNEEQLAHGGATISTFDFLRTAQFWFQSLQNWQSEFLGVGTLFVLTIWLREKGSPQSKPVAAPHSETGG